MLTVRESNGDLTVIPVCQLRHTLGSASCLLARIKSAQLLNALIKAFLEFYLMNNEGLLPK